MTDKQENVQQCIITDEIKKRKSEFNQRAREVADSNSKTLVIKID